MKEKNFLAAMYLRLSRDDEDKDGFVKSESGSIGSQRELIKTFIKEQSDIELYDIYVDDGFSGSNFDRPEFKRMIGDLEAGRANCVIVKDLSRFGRDYIEAGRYIQKIFPALGVRFIALTDHYDSNTADTGETSIILPVKNFINDSYCRDISIKVKSQLEIKRRNGECLAPFAVYGYQKSDKDKNVLVVDMYAAEIVRKIFAWKIEGMAVSAIAEKLKECGILSPKEYKKSIGLNFTGGFSGNGPCAWSNTTVKKILTDEVYLGHMVQGRTERINYKVKKNQKKPREEWVRVKNTHTPIISEDDFAIVQRLLKTDGRKCPSTGRPNPFTGILFCGDCGEQMIRRINRYKGTEKVYYICSTKNRGGACSRHSIKEEKLLELVKCSIVQFANSFLTEKESFEQILSSEMNFEPFACYDRELERIQKERDRYDHLCAGLREDLEKGIITKEEFEHLHAGFQKKSKELERAVIQQNHFVKKMLKERILSAERLKIFQKCLKLEEIDRRILVSMVKKIKVFENKQVEIEFCFQDAFRVILDQNRGISTNKEVIQTVEGRIE